MSENLRERLRLKREQVRLKLALKTIDSILSTSKSLKFIEYLEDSKTPDPIVVWKRVSSFDIEPFQKIPLDSSFEDISFWFKEVLNKLEIGNEIYLSIGGIGSIPWVKVEIVAEDGWLVDFWNLDNHELIVLNSQKDKAVALFEEEDYYEALKLNLGG